MIERDVFDMYKNEKWFKAVEKRTNYEKGDESYENSGFDFLPKKESKCSPVNFKDFK